ncbi:LacI family DNA-binding transcriptional regulator [Flaviaesturariibacter aridisoli]|uniref:LacI family transcriptional regulator n=1 Tax=Flaviaesturariibacter aridisoli TaxID=2545761 RepID=A0A4R4E259_9BACT|nr:LacI family DNA-binding transcriptional regulator [Flaviaesturariibacter aridisoli]TCZ72947.1 LacI family transcriptional regulator [Flaviaesturariibacter aridisoli]
MNKQATIKDIARTLNISVSTVSRALRNAPDIKPDTRNAVMALCEELSYQPSRLALSFQQRQTHTIGVIVPNLDWVLSQMVKGIDEVALEAGYTVMVCQSNESFGREMVNTRRLLESLVDGFIISVSSETKVFDHFRKIQQKKMPMVFFDRVSPDIAGPRVRLDNVDGGYQATMHLLEQGYRRIAVLAGPRNLGIGNDRLEGYLQALKQHRIKVDPDLIKYCDFNQQNAFEATNDLLRRKKRPDAIFAISDRMAIGALLAIRDWDLQMPQDIGLVGFNNEPAVSLVTPTISSVEQPAFELGKTAAKLFIERMHNDSGMDDVEIVLKPKLFVRASSLKKEAPAKVLPPKRKRGV